MAGGGGYGMLRVYALRPIKSSGVSLSLASLGDRVVSTTQMTKGSQHVVRATKQVPSPGVPPWKGWPGNEKDDDEETPKYFVDTVCERMRLNKDTVVP